MIFLEFLLFLVEFVAERELAKPETAEDGVACDDDDSGEGDKEQVVGDEPEVLLEGLLRVGFGWGDEVGEGKLVG